MLKNRYLFQKYLMKIQSSFFTGDFNLESGLPTLFFRSLRSQKQVFSLLYSCRIRGFLHSLYRDQIKKTPDPMENLRTFKTYQITINLYYSDHHIIYQEIIKGWIATCIHIYCPQCRHPSSNLPSPTTRGFEPSSKYPSPLPLRSLA